MKQVMHWKCVRVSLHFVLYLRFSPLSVCYASLSICLSVRLLHIYVCLPAMK